MTRDWYKALVLLMWIALPINALNYWRVWDRLPSRMAVHFDANWQPNGYTSKEGAVMLGMGILATMLVIFTVAMLTSHALKPSSSWPVLIISYFVLGVIWYGNSSIIEFNLKAQSTQSELMRAKKVELRSTGQPLRRAALAQGRLKRASVATRNLLKRASVATRNLKLRS